MYSPTGYFAHYRTVLYRGDDVIHSRVEVYPVIGHADGLALVINEEGKVRTVTELLDEDYTPESGRKNADTDGTWFNAYLAVHATPGE